MIPTPLERNVVLTIDTRPSSIIGSTSIPKDHRRGCGSVASRWFAILVAFHLSWAVPAHADRGDVPSPSTSQKENATVKLPQPKQAGSVSVEEALRRRRSVREFADAALSDAEHGQLLWSTQGVTHRTLGLRTAPSAGALYPLEIYLANRAGVFHYEPGAHELHRISTTDVRKELFDAALRQESVRDAPAVFILVGSYERTAKKYGSDRARRYVHLEAGHAAQNLLLQAVALDLVAVPIGAFEDEKVQNALDLPSTHQPLYLVPVGRPVR